MLDSQCAHHHKYLQVIIGTPHFTAELQRLVEQTGPYWLYQITQPCRQIHSVKVLRPTQHKIGHFGDVLPSQSLGVVLKKLNLTQQKQITQEQNCLN